MSYIQKSYTGYKRVAVGMRFIDNGDGQMYLRLMFPNGEFIKIWPDIGELGSLHEAMQEILNEYPEEQVP